EVSGTVCRIYAQTADAGSAEEEVSVDHDGEPYMAYFNAQSLLDMLGAVRGDRYRMEMSGYMNRPVLLLSADGDVGTHTMVLLPINDFAPCVSGWKAEEVVHRMSRGS